MVSAEVTTDTSVPIFSFDEARDFILDQIRNNGQCRLPCIWGLTPGEDQTTVEGYFRKFPHDYKDEFMIVPSQHDESGGVSYQFVNEYGMTFLDLSYYLENEKLDRLFFNAQFAAGQNDQFVDVFGHPSLDELVKNYSLSQILTDYGPPNEILFFAWDLDPMDKRTREPFLIAIFYSEEGFLIQYNGQATQNNGSQLVICPRELSVLLTSWDPELSPTLEQVTVGDSGFTLMSRYVDSYKSIGEVSSISEEQFFETFVYPESTECFETSVELWLP